MIGFMPSLYTDELVYSWFSRYYAHSGYPAYVFALEDLLEKRTGRADFEFINAFNSDARNVIDKMVSMEDLILYHTMFPYARFVPMQRQTEALEGMIKQEGEAHFLLPIPKNNEPQYIKYCPMCAKEDREKYGEAFWRRTAQIKKVNICAKHRCLLKSTEIEVSGKKSPRLYIAEEVIQDTVPEMAENEQEIQLAAYITEVFQTPIVMGNMTGIGDFLHARLEGTPYISARGKRRNIDMLFHDFMMFYQTIPNQGITQLSQMQKIFTGYRWSFYEVCQLAFFLNISAQDLTNPSIPKETQTERFNKQVAELQEKGLSRYQIAKMMNASPTTIRKANQIKPKAKHNYAVRKGLKRNAWDKMDNEMLPTIRKTCEQIYHKGGRPGRITVYAVSHALELPDKRLEYLPKCLKAVQEYAEEYPVYWAREIVWAYGQLIEMKDQKSIRWREIRDMTNLRKTNFIAAFDFLPLFTDETTAKLIKSLV